MFFLCSYAPFSDFHSICYYLPVSIQNPSPDSSRLFFFCSLVSAPHPLQDALLLPPHVLLLLLLLLPSSSFSPSLSSSSCSSCSSSSSSPSSSFPSIIRVGSVRGNRQIQFLPRDALIERQNIFRRRLEVGGGIIGRGDVAIILAPVLQRSKRFFHLARKETKRGREDTNEREMS